MHLTWRSVPQCCRWLMIVSRHTAVLPVFWSPMISSRWPRPMLVIASMALMPVSRGSFTDWRWTTEGACSSRARLPSASMSPLPSTGRPSGSTTRPRKPSPTGTDSTRPVRWTSSPSSMPADSPKMMQPISRRSRLRAVPRSPPGNSSSSLAMADGSPSTWAMPSPASVTRPTSSRVTVGRNDSTFFLRAAAISSGRMESSVKVFAPSPCSSNSATAALRHAQAFASLLDAAADTAVEHLVPDADDDRPHDPRIHGVAQLDRAAEHPGERLGQARLALGVQRHGRAHVGDHPVAALGGHLGQLAAAAVQLAALLQVQRELDQADRARVVLAADQVVHQRPLAVQRQHRDGQRRAQLGRPRDHGPEAEQVVLDPVEVAGRVG